MSTPSNPLLAIQQALKAPKNQFNKFGGYAYRSCEDILEALKPLLVQHNCILTLSDEVVAIGDRNYVKATASLQYTAMDESSLLYSTTKTVNAYACEPKEAKGTSPSQITGAASSYARKYALNGLFLIDDTKDADATNDHGKSEEAPKGRSYEVRQDAPKPEPAKKPMQPGPPEGDFVCERPKLKGTRVKDFSEDQLHYFAGLKSIKGVMFKPADDHDQELKMACKVWLDFIDEIPFA